MTAVMVEAPVSAAVRRAVRRGWAAYEAATAEGPSDEWDKRVIDRVIYAFVRQGHPFSANDVRPHLPPVRKCLLSRRLIVAQNDGLIEKTGSTPSSLESTNAADVKVYRPLPNAVARLRGSRR